VEPEVSPVARRWVLVLDFNFTDGTWRWRNVTVVSGWELKWNNETVYVFQAPIKKSLGEMIKIQKEVSWRLLVKEELKGVTGVGVVLDKIIVTTENATATQDAHQKKAVDPAAAERIKRFIKSIDPEVEVEVLYDNPEPAQSRNNRFRPVVGGIRIEQVYRRSGVFSGYYDLVQHDADASNAFQLLLHEKSPTYFFLHLHHFA
jgi:hypothetical protein